MVGAEVHQTPALGRRGVQLLLYTPMIPYTLVLKPGRVIFSVYNGYWFWGRPSFEDLRRDLIRN